MKIHLMSRGNEGMHLWLDIKAFGYWWVLLWYKGYRPYMYRSTDATPPCEDNKGLWLFGRRTGVRM